MTQVSVPKGILTAWNSRVRAPASASETKYRREVVKVHAVPRELARNKKRASKFEEQWNIHVSPGNIWYYQTDGTKSMMKEAVEKGWLPYDIVRQKEVFL